VVGRFFSSFSDAWEYFLARAEPLEWFFGDFPEDEDFVAEGWLIEPPSGIKQAARQLQEAFTGIEWVAAIPDHFLHVWLGGPISLGGHPATLAGSGAFELTYYRLNCFHSALVVEADAPELPRLVEGTAIDAATFLPHMTIGVTREEHDPDDLRQVVLPLREVELGTATVTELKRVRFPAARTTLLQPWAVVETVTL